MDTAKQIDALHDAIDILYRAMSGMTGGASAVFMTLHSAKDYLKAQERELVDALKS